jgi:beta-lactamase superfamily II metal-dependent hydrolase
VLAFSSLPTGRLIVSLLLAALPAFAARKMEIFLIDVEGGQSTLFVSPKGESLLVDTGWPGNAYRDANRIVKAASLAGVKKIDYLLVTHYHVDHVGGVPQLVSKMKPGTFIDHGPNQEDSNSTRVGYEDYLKAIGDSKHLVVKPGDHLPIKGFDAVVVSANGNVLESALPGAGQPNTFCAETQQKASDPSENARSLGLVITYAGVRILDLGDLTWNKELALVCPDNKIGPIDLDIVSHHGMDLSNSPALVHAVAPRVAIFDNGSKKGAAPSAWDIVKSSPGLQDIWQLHFADAGAKDHNAPDPFLANVEEADTGYYLTVTIDPNGSYTVFNPRNKFSKSYTKR